MSSSIVRDAPPVVAEPLEDTPGSFTTISIDLLELCRRIIAEYQYIDTKLIGQLSSYEAGISVSSELDTVLQASSVTPLTPAIRSSMPGMASLAGKYFNKIGLQLDADLPTLKETQITRKNFSEMKNDRISKAHVDRLYWMMRLRYTCSLLNMVVGQLIPKLEGMGYNGFRLPNGITVPLKSLLIVGMDVVPKEYNLYHFKKAGTPGVFCKIQLNHFKETLKYEPEAIECAYDINPNKGPSFQHTALCFNLPKDNAMDKGGSGLYIVDISYAQFGLRGPDGGLVYFGSSENYLKALQAEKLMLLEFAFWDYMDGTFYPKGPLLVDNVLRRITLPVCDYCGESEGRRKLGQEFTTITLTKCRFCEGTKYCDDLCEELHCPSHKLENIEPEKVGGN